MEPSILSLLPPVVAIGLAIATRRILPWFEKGVPLTFVLYANGEGQPHVRAIAQQGNYRRHARRPAEWAQRVNASSEPLIDENFTPLAGCRDWRSRTW